MNAPINHPRVGRAVEVIVSEDGDREEVLQGELLGRFDRDHVEVKFDDLPFKAIVAKRYVRMAKLEGDAS